MAPLSNAEIHKRFGHHSAAIEGPNPNEYAHGMLRETFVTFVEMLNQVLPDSRDTSLALTALEEASMWSHKAAAKETYEIVDLGTNDPLTFEQELVKLINKHGMEKYSNTADWILCEFVRQMLVAFDLGAGAVDNDDEWAVNDYAAKAVRAFDVGIRLRERQSQPREVSEEAEESLRLAREESSKDWLTLDEFKKTEHFVPLVDRTGETPQVVGHATVVEKADGFHIEGVIEDLPAGLKPVSLGYHAGPLTEDVKPYPQGGVAPLLSHFGVDPARFSRPENTTPDKAAYEDALAKQQPVVEKEGVMHTFIAQKVGVQADGKILLLLGKDDQNFHIQDGDDFYTVTFKTDPFDETKGI